MTIKALLFDKDGTLLDFAATYGAATGRVIDALTDGDRHQMAMLCAALGYRAENAAFEPASVIIAGSLEDIAAAAAPALGRKPGDGLADEIDLLYRHHTRASLTMFPGTEAMLVALIDRGYPLGIATNDTEATARDHLSALGLTTLFPFVAGADSGHGAKPGPGMVEAFAKATGLPTEAIAMIGDSTHDMNAARAAGATAIAVLSGFAGRAELEPLADIVVDTLQELPGIIAG